MKRQLCVPGIARFTILELRRIRIVIALLLCVSCLSFATLCSAQNAESTDYVPWRKTVEWEVLPFENPTVTIQSSLNNPVMNGNGRIEVSLLGGLEPLSEAYIDIYLATMNIAGQWSVGDWHTSVTTDSSGLITKEVKPGDYALTIHGFDLSTGTYGIMAQKGTSECQAIPVTVRQGEVLAVRINLAKLVVGVLSGDGKSVLPDSYVYVYPQSTDIAGNPIPLASFGNSSRSTSEDGTCTWYVGAGEYTIRISNSFKEDLYKYSVVVLPGDAKEIIITMGKAEHEARAMTIEKYRNAGTSIARRGRPSADRVNMRELPSMNASALMLLGKQDDFFVEFEAQNEGNPWYYIRLDSGETGFIMKQFVTLNP